MHGYRRCGSPGWEGLQVSISKGLLALHPAMLPRQDCHLHHPTTRGADSFCLQSGRIFLFTPPTHTEAFSTSHLAGAGLPQPVCNGFVRGLCPCKGIASLLFSSEVHFLGEALLAFSSWLQGCGLFPSAAAPAVCLARGFLVRTQPQRITKALDSD